MTDKPCFCRKQPSHSVEGRFFDPMKVFEAWSRHNQIICDWRARFEDVRDALEWAALDENGEGAHAGCALEWAVSQAGFGTRYPAQGVPL